MDKYIHPSNDTVFPNPEYVTEIEWRLRYDRASITQDDMLYLASICNAYIVTAKPHLKDICDGNNI